MELQFKKSNTHYIIGIDNALNEVAEESFDYYKNAYNINDFKSEDDYRKKVLDTVKSSLIKSHPYTAIIKSLEKEYGEFEIVVRCDDKVSDTMFKQEFCELSNPRLRITNKLRKIPITSFGSLVFQKHDNTECAVSGINLEDAAFNYINKCLDKNYLIRYINKDGEGYATANVREIIFKEYLNNPEIKLQCIK